MFFVCVCVCVRGIDGCEMVLFVVLVVDAAHKHVCWRDAFAAVVHACLCSTFVDPIQCHANSQRQLSEQFGVCCD